MLKREFFTNLKSLIIFSSILVVTYILVIAIYPSIATSGLNINEILKVFPEELLKVFNMDIFDISTALGWLETEGFIFWILLSGFYSAILGATILTKEENDKTIEILLSKPVSRNEVVINKLICGIINVFIFNLLVYLTCVFGLLLIDDLDFKIVTLISIGTFMIDLMLFTITLMISSFFNKTSVTRNIALAIVFLSYIMQIVGGLTSSLEFLKNISIFEFFSVRYIAVNNCLDPLYLILSIIIILCAILITFINYNKKELV